jgi:hypothetical protein
MPGAVTAAQMQSTRKKLIILIPAILAGIAFVLLHQKDENGRITSVDWIIAMITLMFGVGVIFAVGWWGNRKQ